MSPRCSRSLMSLAGLTSVRTDNESLAAIYKKIDQLEKTKLSTRNYHTTYEEFFIFVLAAAFLLLLEYLLRSTILRTNP